MSQAHKWTPKQCEILARASHSPRGGTRLYGSGENAAGRKLADAGFGQATAAFFVNDAGRAALPVALVHADSEAARYLGNANEAFERGDAAKGGRLMQRSQEWMDAANELRGDGAGEAR